MLGNKNGQWESASRKENEAELKTLCCYRSVTKANNELLQTEELMSDLSA